MPRQPVDLLQPSEDGQVTTLILMVGLPGAGKTTVACGLAAERGALRLTPDTWMIPLFGESDPGGKRDVLEGRLISIALDMLRLRVSVILDFGLWGRDERSALRWLAAEVGAACEVAYVEVDPATQLERIQKRWSSTPEDTFMITMDDLRRWRKQFQAPDRAELAGGEVPAVPQPWLSWAQWATERWPSFQLTETVQQQA